MALGHTAGPLLPLRGVSTYRFPRRRSGQAAVTRGKSLENSGATREAYLLFNLTALLGVALAVSTIPEGELGTRTLRLGSIMVAVGIAMWSPPLAAGIAGALVSLSSLYLGGTLGGRPYVEVSGVAIVGGLAAILRYQIQDLSARFPTDPAMVGVEPSGSNQRASSLRMGPPDAEVGNTQPGAALRSPTARDIVGDLAQLHREMEEIRLFLVPQHLRSLHTPELRHQILQPQTTS